MVMSGTPLKAILVVDDSEDDVHMLRRSAKMIGLTNAILHVASVEDAICYFKGEGRFSNRDEYPMPSLVLLDLKFNVRNGLDVLTYIRSQPGLFGVIVIAMSSTEDPAIIRRAYELGANSFLLKPFSNDALDDMLKALHHYWLTLNRT